MNSNLNSELNAELCKLPIEQQFQVLGFARTLTRAKIHGVKGQDLLRFAGTIEPKDLATIAQTIDEGCEKVNLNTEEKRMRCVRRDVLSRKTISG